MLRKAAPEKSLDRGHADRQEPGEQGDWDKQLMLATAGEARELYDRYAGHEGDNLREELAAEVMTYFSAGMETLRY